MRSFWAELSAPILAYLAGAIPFAWLLGRMYGVDLRAVGSRNVGAGNLTRTVGMRAGITAALLDGLKGLGPTLIARRLDFGGGIVTLVGLATVAGHNWSIYMRGRSGRGLATSAGVLIAVDPAMVFWTGGWSATGWKLGGGLAGFIGWALLPLFALWIGRPASAVLVAVGLAALMVVRRIQGNSGRALGAYAAWHRAIWDRDPELEQGGASEPVRS